LSRAVQEAVKDCTTDEDKALAVQRLAVKSVRAVTAPYPLLATSVRGASRIYDTGYASALDGAVLLMAMLKEAGFGSAPSCALVSAGRTFPGDVPAPELCQSILVAVPMRGSGELLLDPSKPLEHDPAVSLAGRTLVFVNRGRERRLWTLPSIEWISDNKSELTLDLSPGADGGFAGRGTAILTGAFSPYYLVRQSENGLADFLKKRVSGLFGGAEITSWNPLSLERDKAQIDFAFTVKLPEKKKGERVYLAMPKPLESSLSGIERVPVERSQCLDIIKVERCTLDLSCTIRLPPGWRMITAPFALRKGDAASVELAPQADGTQLFRRHLLLDDDLVYPGDYGSFRELLKVFNEDRVVFERE